MNMHDCIPERKRFLPIAECMLLMLVLFPPSFASAANSSAPAKAHELTTDEMIDRLRSEKVVSSANSLKIEKEPEELVVTTEKDSKFNDEQTKVQAVLLAKSAFDFAPKLLRTKIVFTEGGQPAYELVIKRIEIEAYAKGTVDKNELLKSLDLTKIAGDSAVSGSSQAGGIDAEAQGPRVVPGIFRADRQRALAEIEALKRVGANTEKTEALFKENESAVASGDPATVKKNLQTIFNAIETQREMLESARQTANGRTMRSSGRSSGGPALRNATNKPLAGESVSSTKGHYAVKDAISILKANHVDISEEERMLRTLTPGALIKLNNKLRDLPAATTEAFYQRYPKFGQKPSLGGSQSNGSLAPAFQRSSSNGGWSRRQNSSN